MQRLNAGALLQATRTHHFRCCLWLACFANELLSFFMKGEFKLYDNRRTIQLAEE